MPDYSEVLDARAAEAAAHPAGPPEQRLMALLRESQRGAAVLTELLDSPAWNIFRSVIGADLQACEAERTVLRDQIEAGSLVGDDRARADLRGQYLRGAIEKLTRAMDLPKQLIAQHATLDQAMGGSGGGEANGVSGHDGARNPEPPPVVRSATGGGSSQPRRKRKKS